MNRDIKEMGGMLHACLPCQAQAWVMWKTRGLRLMRGLDSDRRLKD